MASVNIQQLDICSTKAAVIVQWSINKPLKSLILTSLKQDIHFFVLRIRKVVIAGLKDGLEHLGSRCPVFVAHPQAFFSPT